MTALTLDVRVPLLVVVGNFNPAIFSQNWIATNVFGIPEGAEMSVLEVIMEVERLASVRLSFINDVALNVSPNRMDLFAASAETPSLCAVESALRRVFELLPHTPIHAIGCNFRWTDSEPETSITDLFDTPEGLEGQYEVISRQASIQLSLEQSILNLTRASLENEIQFNFNYHRNFDGIENCIDTVEGMIINNLQHSTEIMKNIYGYKDFKTVGFVSEQEKELIDATSESN